MEFLHASIALLASMVLVLAGMVGWLYWQQTRLFQNMNSIVMVIGELARPQVNMLTTTTEEEEPATEAVPLPESVDEIEIDDRASVDADVSAPMADIVDGAVDTDSLEGKTAAELKEMLTKKGIPFGKRDSKGVLISLLKATA